MEMRQIIIPEMQYKNLKFIVREIKILLDNLAPILEKEFEKYNNKMKVVITNLDNRELYLNEVTRNNQITNIQTKELLTKTIDYILNIKSELIRNEKVRNILYIKEDDNMKKW
jgi:hypothetical protein